MIGSETKGTANGTKWLDLAVYPGPLCDIRWSGVISSLASRRFPPKPVTAKLDLGAVAAGCDAPALVALLPPDFLFLRAGGSKAIPCALAPSTSQTDPKRTAEPCTFPLPRVLRHVRDAPSASPEATCRGASWLWPYLQRFPGTTAEAGWCEPKPRFTVPPKTVKRIIVRQTAPAGAGIPPVRFHLRFPSMIKIDGLGCQLSDAIHPSRYGTRYGRSFQMIPTLPLGLSVMRTDVTHPPLSVRLRLQMGDTTHTSYSTMSDITGRIVRAW